MSKLRGTAGPCSAYGLSPSPVHPVTDIPGRDRQKLLVRLEGGYSRSSENDSNPEQTVAQVIALALSFSELY